MFPLRGVWFVDADSGSVLAGKRFSVAETRAAQLAKVPGRHAAWCASIRDVSDDILVRAVMDRAGGAEVLLRRSPGGTVTLGAEHGGTGPFHVIPARNGVVLNALQGNAALSELEEAGSESDGTSRTTFFPGGDKPGPGWAGTRVPAILRQDRSNIIIVTLPLAFPTSDTPQSRANSSTMFLPYITASYELTTRRLAGIVNNMCIVRVPLPEDTRKETLKAFSAAVAATTRRLMVMSPWLEAVQQFFALAMPFGSETPMSARASHLIPALLTRCEERYLYGPTGLHGADEANMTIGAIESSRTLDSADGGMRAADESDSKGKGANKAAHTTAIRVSLIEELSAQLGRGEEFDMVDVRGLVVAQAPAAAATACQNAERGEIAAIAGANARSDDMSTLILVGHPDRCTTLVVDDDVTFPTIHTYESTIGVATGKKPSAMFKGMPQVQLHEALQRAVFNHRATLMTGSPLRRALTRGEQAPGSSGQMSPSGTPTHGSSVSSKDKVANAVLATMMDVSGIQKWGLLHAHNTFEHNQAHRASSSWPPLPQAQAPIASFSIRGGENNVDVPRFWSGSLRAYPVHPSAFAHPPKDITAVASETTLQRISELSRIPGFLLMRVEFEMTLNLSVANGAAFTLSKADFTEMAVQFSIMDNVSIAAWVLVPQGKEKEGGAVSEIRKGPGIGEVRGLNWQLPLKQRKHGATFSIAGFAVCDVSGKGMRPHPGGAAAAAHDAAADEAQSGDGSLGQHANLLQHEDVEANLFAAAVIADGLLPCITASVKFSCRVPQSVSSQVVLTDAATLNEFVTEADANALGALHSGSSPPRESHAAGSVHPFRDELRIPVKIGAAPAAKPGSAGPVAPTLERAVVVRSHPENGYVFFNSVN